MSTATQRRRLIECGAPELAGVSTAEFSAYADGLPDVPDAVLVVHPS